MELLYEFVSVILIILIEGKICPFQIKTFISLYFYFKPISNYEFNQMNLGYSCFH